MRIGLDLHGVIDRFPREFAILTHRWVKVYRHHVHVVTGSPWKVAEPQVERCGICYTHSFSIVDYHREIGTPMVEKENGWWMEQDVWNRTKGDYAARVDLDVHFEDSLEYATWFPKTCTFVHIGQNFGEVLPIIDGFMEVWGSLNTKV
jgi:hypothetical protein